MLGRCRPGGFVKGTGDCPGRASTGVNEAEHLEHGYGCQNRTSLFGFFQPAVMIFSGSCSRRAACGHLPILGQKTGVPSYVTVPSTGTDNIVQ
jgi:hypothetical protein